MKNRHFYQSLGHALAGIESALRHERNLRFDCVALLAVVAAGVALRVAASDWRWLIACGVAVLAAELFNTAIERAVHAIPTAAGSQAAKRALDIAAGATLVVAIGAAVIGALVLWPYLKGMSA